jgi:uncharacterized protein YbaR (Trm112 family)
LHPQLLEILACPDTHHTPLVYDEPGQSLTCPECGKVYPIKDGLPELLLGDADRDETDADPDAARDADPDAARDAAADAVADPGEARET